MKINVQVEKYNKQGYGCIKVYITNYFKVSVNGNIKYDRIVINLPHTQVHKDDWDSKHKVCKNRTVNSRLSQALELIEFAFHSLQMDRVNITPATLKDKLKSMQAWQDLFGLQPTEVKNTITDFIKQYILTSDRIKDGSKINYKSLISVLDKFKAELTFDGMTLPVYQQFAKYLQRKGNNQNTIHQQSNLLRSVFKQADKMHLDVCKDYTEFRVKAKPVDNSQKRITDDMMIKLRMACKSIAQMKAIDILDLLKQTGLRLSDRDKVMISNIQISEGNEYWQITAKKTGKDCIIPVTPVAKEILLKYGGQAPVMSDEQVKHHLRNISKTTGIKVTSHYGRHSMANNMLAEGIDANIVKLVTGHTTAKGLQPYNHIKTEEKVHLLFGSK